MIHGLKKSILASAGTLALLTLFSGCSGADKQQGDDTTPTTDTTDTTGDEGYTVGPSDDPGTDVQPPANVEDLTAADGSFDEPLTAGETIYVTSDTNLYSDASPSSNAVTVVPENSQVTVVQPAANAGFFQVKYGDQTGWVTSLFLATQADVDGVPLTPDDPTVPSVSPESESLSPASTGGVSAPSTAETNGVYYVNRALQWVAAKMPYCGGVNGGTDLICGGTCTRTGTANNPTWNKYRSDCSGLVSWAWKVPAPGQTTAGLAPFNSKYSYGVSYKALRPGDAINSVPSHHIMLFAGWADKGMTVARVVQEYNCGHIAAKMKLPVTHNGKYLFLSWDNRNFLAIRRRH